MKLPLPKPSMPARLAAGLLTMVIALALSPMLPAAAGAQSSKLYETVGEATLKPGMAIPEPSGPVILTVSGKIRSGKPVRFDLATLESLGLIRFTTPTNWTAEPSEFEGVLLSALLDAVGVDPAATTLNFTALNDYE